MDHNNRNRSEAAGFTEAVLDWHRAAVRRDLPWVGNSDPYVVWISEIMLQQTQAQTVSPYFENFLASFPNVTVLAGASVDSVLSHWAGLGYYARARNLHRAAQIVVSKFGGEFPETKAEMLQLPGIGRSTAGAISALAFGRPEPILDGNAKRVYSRVYCVEDKSRSKVERILWDLARARTSVSSPGAYTQAIMDLGATVCSPRGPRCDKCPLSDQCEAYINGVVDLYPMRSARKKLKQREIMMLIITNSTEQVLLERRPPSGIWGGLWSFPEHEGKSSDVSRWLQSRYGVRADIGLPWPTIRHKFTHFELAITPLPVSINGVLDIVENNEQTSRFYNLSDTTKLGTPVPVRKLLQKLCWRLEFSQVESVEDARIHRP